MLLRKEAKKVITGPYYSRVVTPMLQDKFTLLRMDTCHTGKMDFTHVKTVYQCKESISCKLMKVSGERMILDAFKIL